MYFGTMNKHSSAANVKYTNYTHAPYENGIETVAKNMLYLDIEIRGLNASNEINNT